MPPVFDPLKPDEPIGVAALSGPVDAGRFESGLAVLESWGHPVILASNVCGRSGYLAGDDDARLRGLAELLDRGLRCVIAARGGYGVTRLLDAVPWGRLVADRVFFVGYSDLTAVLNPLVAMGGAVQLHGPVVTELGRNQNGADRLCRIIGGERHDDVLFEFSRDAVVRQGRATGIAMGGNLSLLATLAGTPFAPVLRGAVLFLEDVNEPLYRLDRLLTQLRSSAILNGVKAIISGYLGDIDLIAAERWRELLLEVVPGNVPVVDNVSFGHGEENLAFPIGAEVEVDTTAGTVRWRT